MGLLLFLAWSMGVEVGSIGWLVLMGEDGWSSMMRGWVSEGRTIVYFLMSNMVL